MSYRVKLPAKIGAGANAGKPNLIEITSGKMSKTGEGGEKVAVKFGDASYTDSEGKEHIGIPAELWEYPQFGPEPQKNDKGDYLRHTPDEAQVALDEMIKDAGGIVEFTENYNDATRSAALGKGKVFIRTKEDGEPKEIVTEGLRQSREFSWAQAERVTNKSVREGAEKLAAEYDTLSEDERKRRLLELLGKR